MGAPQPAEVVDPLSQMIALVRPQALQWRVVEADDAWTIRFPSVDAVVFGQVLEGAFHVRREDGQTFDMHAGDFMMMASPPRWSASTPGDGPEVDFLDCIADPSRLLSGGAAPARTRFLAGYFTFAPENTELLGALMPPLALVRSREVDAGRLGLLLRMLGEEAGLARPGRALVLDRLLEITLVEVLRRQGPAVDPGRPGLLGGLLAGLGHPQIGTALKLIHRNPQRPWTVSDLARRSGMSRSSFAARFAETVGATPIEYLSEWRMSLARAALASANHPMSRVAELAGYQSVSAFSTAFKRIAGRSPTDYQRTLGAPAGATSAPGHGARRALVGGEGFEPPTLSV